MSSKVAILIFLISSASAALPSSFKKCHRKQPDFEECLRDAIQKAIKQVTKPFPEIGLPSIDPLEIPSLSIEPGNGAVGFGQTYKNMKIYGFSKSNCSDIRMDFEKRKLTTRCTADSYRAEFDYEYNGKILLLPFSGKGPGESTLVEPQTSLTFTFDEYMKKGKKHLKVVKTEFKWTPRKMLFKFDNLVGGDEQLSKNLINVFNDNWEALYEDVGPSYEYAFGQVLEAIYNRVLARLSVEELYGE